MKKILVSLLTTTLLFSCGGNSNSDDASAADNGKGLIAEKVDYKFLTNETEVKKVLDGIVAKAGDNISKIDKIEIWVTRPSKEGIVRRNNPDYASITLSYLNPNDPKKLFEYRYNSEDSKWNAGASKTVKLILGDVESFILADEMYDASALTSDMVIEAIKEAWNMYKDDNKYSDQWVKSVTIHKGQIDVSVKGILAANDLEYTESYKKRI